MREEVAIVLNDREAPKLNTVKALLAFFRDHNITASQIRVSEDISRIVLERCPKVLILDYLLGDYSTGLDILHEINSLPPDRRPTVYFLTDEPSINAAVTAMKLGAKNYYEISNPLSTKALVNEVDKFLAGSRIPRPTGSAAKLTLKDLNLQSKIYGKLIENSLIISKRRAPIVVVHGPAGSGKSALARAIHLEHQGNANFLELELDIYTEPLDLLIRPSDYSNVNLGQNFCLAIDHLTKEQQSARNLIELVTQYQSNIWPDNLKNQRENYLLLGTESLEIASEWAKRLKAEVLSIPPLEKHPEDIPLLVSRFVNFAAHQSGLKIKQLDTNLVMWLSQQNWPGDVKQLQSIVINAAIRSTFNDKELKTYLEEQLEEYVRGRVTA